MTTSPEDALSPEAENAWLAYQAMGESKKTYFGFLQDLDQKYNKNESASIAENLKLEQLLKVHDTNVSAFNEAMSKVEEPDARQALMSMLTSASAISSTN
jgi:hypothetical protein